MTHPQPKSRDRTFVQQFDSTYCEVFCKEYSTVESSEEVLFVPDFIGNSADFEKICLFLAANSIKSTAVDLPGRGKSAAVPTKHATLLNYASVVLATAQECKMKRPIIVGKGWGGIVACLASVLAPGAFHSVVLIDSRLNWDDIDYEGLASLQKLAQSDFAQKQDLALELAEYSRIFPELSHKPFVLNNRIHELDGRFRTNFHPLIFDIAINTQISREFTGLIERLTLPVYKVNSDSNTISDLDTEKNWPKIQNLDVQVGDVGENVSLQSDLWCFIIHSVLASSLNSEFCALDLLNIQK